MITIYDTEIDNETVCGNLDRLTNQIFKLLPNYEEGKDWEKPLETIVLELAGLNGLFPGNPELTKLLCKLQGLLETPDIDFMSFRRTVFECCSLSSKIKTHII